MPWLPSPIPCLSTIRCYLYDAADLVDLRSSPANRLEKLKGALKGRYSIPINDQWRVVFRWETGAAHEVQVVDYHD